MTNFAQYLKNYGNGRDAAAAFFRSLRQRGVHVSTKGVARALRFGTEGQPDPSIHNLVKNVLAIDHDNMHADQFVHELADAGFHVDCSPLVANPVLYGKNVHHDKTHRDLMARYSVYRGVIDQSPLSAALFHLFQLRQHGINLSDETRIARLLPTEHLPVLLTDPSFILEIAQYTGSTLMRCLPANAEIVHPGRSRFILDEKGLCYDDSDRYLERNALQRGIPISDGICSECFPHYWKRELSDLPIPRVRGD